MSECKAHAPIGEDKVRARYEATYCFMVSGSILKARFDCCGTYDIRTKKGREWGFPKCGIKLPKLSFKTSPYHARFSIRVSNVIILFLPRNERNVRTDVREINFFFFLFWGWMIIMRNYVMPQFTNYNVRSQGGANFFSFLVPGIFAFSPTTS